MKTYYYVNLIVTDDKNIKEYFPIAIVDSYINAIDIVTMFNAFNLCKSYEYTVSTVSRSFVPLIKNKLKK